MTNITADWPQIFVMAKRYGLPQTKKRAIIREYLQVKILQLLYAQKFSKRVFFVGGTALRILHGLDRFSEDLDFDAPKLTQSEIHKMLSGIRDALKRENVSAEMYQNKTAKKTYFELRFPMLLFETGISPNRSEKLAIQFDFEPFWKNQNREVLLLNRFGFLARVVSKTLDQFVVEKLAAYIGRKETAARDLYDLVWLMSRGATGDAVFAKNNGLDIGKLLTAAQKKFTTENPAALKRRLQPFLLDEKRVGTIDFFQDLASRTKHTVYRE